MPRSLRTMQLKGYRAFKDFRLDDLSRVNLIVGKNNAGKTSVLEAIHLLANSGEPSTLMRLALDRGETLTFDPEPNDYRRSTGGVVADISHFFHGHKFGIDSRFEIASGNGLGTVVAEIIDPAQLGENESLYLSRANSLFEEEVFEGELALRLRGSAISKHLTSLAYPVTNEGGFNFDPTELVRVRPVRRRVRTETIPTVVITPSSLQPSSMSGMWERVIRAGRERAIIEALGILDQGIDGVFFLPGERIMRGRGGILISRRGSKRRIPLGSMGEGMRRILALAISFAQAQRGFLLIDEIDTGLHWSVMPRMWELTLATARDLDVQVFATTHSLDCLRGLKEAVDARPELGEEVRVHKVDTTLREAVTFTSQDLMVAVEQEIEVRG